MHSHECVYLDECSIVVYIRFIQIIAIKVEYDAIKSDEHLYIGILCRYCPYLEE